MNEFTKQMEELLPEFMDEVYPKGKKGRGEATVAIVLFILWLRGNLK